MPEAVNPPLARDNVARHRRKLACLLLGASASWPAQVQAQIYVGHAGTEPGAAVVLSNFASDATPTLLLEGASPMTPAAPLEPAAPRPGPSAPARDRPAFARVIAEVSDRVGVSPLLVHAVIAAESNYDPLARSPKGALGLMQLMPATAAQFGVLQPFDARENIVGGTQYLRWLAERLGNRIDLVLAAYNAGLGQVVKAGYRVPAIPETQTYVRRVLARVACMKANECRGLS